LFAWLTRPRHLPVSSTFSSLIGLLSSSRSNEEIQSELVEILGFEGEGLQLVEELLRPGKRDRVVQDSGLVNGKVREFWRNHAPRTLAYACVRSRSSVTETLQGSKKASGTSTPRGQYLPSARLTVNAAKGKEKKQKIDLADMIGSSDDIARRIQEQLERPKAMFSEGGPVRR
jgi:antiviral helicase SLH1